MNRTLIKLQPTPTELLHNCESFFQELSDIDSIIIYGCQNNTDFEKDSLERKLLEYALVGFAIQNIVSLVKLFFDNSQQRSPAK